MTLKCASARAVGWSVPRVSALLLALLAPSAQAEALPDPWPKDAYPGPALHIPDPDVDFRMTGGFGNSAYIWIGDFNGDGITDVASAMGAVGRIAESRGNDTWVTVDHDTRSPYWGHASYARVGDFDGDGKDDFISVEGDDIVIRRASEGFAMARFDVPGGWGEAAMTRVGDFDGDGKDDYATIRPTAVHVHLARFAAGGDFDSQPWAVTDWWGQPGYTFVGDFNGDGRDDIATAQYGDIRVRLSTGSGFTEETWTVPANWGAGHSSFVGDFNGDGKADIVSVQNDFINENQSTGSGFIQRRSGAIKATGEYLMVGDFDGDGRDDVASPAGDVVRIYARREGDDRLHLAEEWHVPNSWGATYLTWAGRFTPGSETHGTMTIRGSDVYVLRRREPAPAAPDAGAIGFVGSPKSYTPAQFKQLLHDHDLTLVDGRTFDPLTTALKAGECTIAYASADAGGNAAEFGALTCAYQITDDLTLTVNAVYGGCEFAARGAGHKCEVGVFASELTFETGVPVPAELTTSVAGPKAELCQEMSTKRQCYSIGGDLVEAGVEVSDAYGNGIGASVGIGVGYGWDSGYEDGVLSVDMDLKVIAGGSITFNVGVEEDAKAVIALGKAGYARVGGEVVAASPSLLRAVPNVASTTLSGANDAAGKAVVALRSADSFSAKLVDRGYGWVGDLAGVVGSWFKFW